MGLQFQPPPDWLIQEYVNRKQPAEIMNEGVGNAINTYASLKKQQDDQAIRQRQMKLLEQKQAMEGRDNFYKYGDISGLNPEEQSVFNPVQGPSNQVPVDYQTAQNAQLGGAQGPVVSMTQEVPPSEPKLSPVLQYFKDFHQAYPQGTSGQQFTEDTIAQKDTAGNIVGYSTVKRPMKGRTLLAGPSQMGTPQLAEIPGTGQMAWFTPPTPVAPGNTSTPSVNPSGVPTRPGATVTPVAQGLGKGQQAVDLAFAKDYNDFVAQGGQSDPVKLVSGIDDAIKKLEGGAQASGRFMGAIGRAGRTFVSPDAGVIEDQVRDAVQRNLRIILGGQFAEREGENLVRTAYNTGLPEKEVAKRLRALSTQMTLALQAKQAAANYWEQHGTLNGFKGKTYTMADFQQTVSGNDGGKLGGQETPEQRKARLIAEAQGAQ